MAFVQEQQPQGYVARISFPPRRTADGARISDMPVAEAQRVLAELTAAASGGGQTAPQQETAPRAVCSCPTHNSLIGLSCL